MKFNLIRNALLLSFIICSCSKGKERVTADLSFRSITFASAYGASEEEYKSYITHIDSVINSSISKNFDEIEDYKRLKKLHNEGVLKLPLIYLHFGKDSIMPVYLSEKEYDKIKNIRHIDLFKENMKVVLELDVIEKDDGIYFSDNIINHKKVEGRSRSNVKSH